MTAHLEVYICSKMLTSRPRMVLWEFYSKRLTQCTVPGMQDIRSGGLFEAHTKESHAAVADSRLLIFLGNFRRKRETMPRRHLLATTTCPNLPVNWSYRQVLHPLPHILRQARNSTCPDWTFVSRRGGWWLVRWSGESGRWWLCCVWLITLTEILMAICRSTSMAKDYYLVTIPVP